VYYSPSAARVPPQLSFKHIYGQRALVPGSIVVDGKSQPLQAPHLLPSLLHQTSLSLVKTWNLVDGFMEMEPGQGHFHLIKEKKRA
jgi:hypothetical protein